MPAETTSSSQNSSVFSNDTQNPDYFLICINHRIRIQLWICYSLFCFLLGFPASLRVLHKLCQRRQQSISNDFFVFNLAIIDLALLSFLPFYAANYTVWHNVTLDEFCTFIYTLSLSGRPLFMACVCGEYYFAVLHPIIYRTSKRTAMIRKTISLMIWLFIVSFGSIITSIPLLFTSTFASSPLLIALPIICFCDVSVFRALRKKDPSGKTTVHPQKKKALRTIISSFVMTFTVYLPPAVIFAMGHNIKLSNTELYYCVLNFLAVCFSVSGCFIMPVLYLESTDQLNVRIMADKMQSFISSCVRGK